MSVSFTESRTSRPWFRLDYSAQHRQREECRGRTGDLVIEGALGSRSSVLVDFDDDGDLDVITNEFGDSPQVLVSDLSERRAERLNFVKIVLHGRASNRDGLGARVSLVTASGRQTQNHDGMSGYLAQSSLPLYFGLGDDDGVQSIDVRWPSGRHSRHVPQLPLNRVLVLREPED